MMADLLAPTLGPTGGHVVSQTDRSDQFEVLNDSAVTLRRVLSLGRPELDVGAMAMRSMVWRMGQRAGDGGATTAVLMRAVYNDGLRLTTAGINAMQLTRGLRQASDIAIATIRALSTPVQTEDELAAVARTVTQDQNLAAVLGEMSYLLGPDAHVIIEKYVAPYLQRRYIGGAHYPAQIASMYLYTDVAHKSAVMAAPAVVVVDERLTTAEQVVPLLEAALAVEAKALLIVATELSGEALGVVVANQQAPADKRKLQLLAAKLTSVGDELRTSRDDLALMTGATLLGTNGGRRAADVRPTDLGQAQRAEFADKALVVVANRTARETIQLEVANLRQRIQEMPLDDEDRVKLIKRLATLSGGIGELKVGAHTKSQRTVLENLAERALKVLSAAQRNGVVPGAGAAMHHAGQQLLVEAQNGNYAEDVAHGLRILAHALSAPLQQIVTNTGTHAPSVILHRLNEAGPDATYDALTGQVVDAHTGGILDVTDVVAMAVQTAVSGAMMLLSTDTIVYHSKPEQMLAP